MCVIFLNITKHKQIQETMEGDKGIEGIKERR
jgi:hypothetical protein